MRKNVNRVKCDIQSHIIAAGYTQKETVEACAAEYGWSDSDSNFSNKLEKQTIRYREVLERCMPIRVNDQNIRELNKEANLERMKRLLEDG